MAGKLAVRNANYLPKLTPSSTISTIVVERFITLVITSKISADYKIREKVMRIQGT
jgi:hypothetical protein